MLLFLVSMLARCRGFADLRLFNHLASSWEPLLEGQPVDSFEPRPRWSEVVSVRLTTLWIDTKAASGKFAPLKAECQALGNQALMCLGFEFDLAWNQATYKRNCAMSRSAGKS